MSSDTTSLLDDDENDSILIHPSEPLKNLATQYSENMRFLPGIEMLSKRYPTFQRVKGDGNCFYRAFLYSVLRYSKTHEETRLKLLNTHIRPSMEWLVSIGYSEMAIEVFYDAMVEALESLPNTSQAELETLFSTDGNSEYLVWYMRLMTAGYLKANADRFLPFIIAGGDSLVTTVEQFCAEQVEPMGRECEHLQILALAECLEIPVVIEYLDGTTAEGEDVKTVTCGKMEDNNDSVVVLLYRPGHYDILHNAKSIKDVNTFTKS